MGTMLRSDQRGSGLKVFRKGQELNMLELVDVVNKRYRASMLRRKSLPNGFCYVCSRLDPSGIFRNPNSHLFKSGFFHKGPCEHFPKAPYTTFVADDNEGSIPEEDADGLGTVETDTPHSISVTIKRASVSDSYARQYNYDGGEPRQSVAGTPLSKEADGAKVLRMPRMFRTNSSSKNSSSSQDTGRFLPMVTDEPTKSKKGDSETQPHLPPIVTNDRSRRSPILQGTTESIMNDEIKPKARSEDPDSIPRIINASDGLNESNIGRPVLNDLSALEGTLQGRKSKATRFPEKLGTDRSSDSHSSDNSRPGSGHLRYHHRSSDDSVPYPGFRIPDTPTELELQRIASEARLSQDGGPDDGRMTFDTLDTGSRRAASSKLFTDDDETIILSESASVRIRGLSSGGSFCRCTANREQTAEKGSKFPDTCKTCGKTLNRGACVSSKGHSDLTLQGKGSSLEDFRDSRGSRSKNSFRSTSKNTREKMLFDSKANRQVANKTATDEDYMDIDSIIYEDDGRYWSSEEGFMSPSRATTESSRRRLRNANPFPLVDPNVHKEVYLRALNEVYTKRLLRRGTDGEDQFTRPNVFSYYQLWPFAGRKCSDCGNDIGIRPDNTPVAKATKNNSLMKHIFKDVKMEDYYPPLKVSNVSYPAAKSVVHDQLAPGTDKGRVSTMRFNKAPK